MSDPPALADIDHAQPFPMGGTDRDNLHAVNRTWHRAKTIGNWIVKALGDGRLTWTSPHGIETTVEPHDYRLGP